MHDTGFWLLTLAVVAWLLLGDSKKVSWIRLPRLVKATKTKRGTTYSAFLPAKPKARKRKR